MSNKNKYEPVLAYKKFYFETPLELRRLVNEVDLEDCFVYCPYYYTCLSFDGCRIVFGLEPIDFCETYILDELYERNEVYKICVEYCLDRSVIRTVKRPRLRKRIYIGQDPLSADLKVDKSVELLFDMYLARNNFIPDFDIEIFDLDFSDKAGDTDV